MLLIKILFYSLSSYVIHSELQINLYLTDRTSSDQNYNGLLHDCLYATSARRFDREPYQIIPYCLGEWSSTWKIQTNNTDSKFTFAQLASANITSEQLYLWSAPMDTIQHYQSYLDESPNSATKLLAEEYFYNCTLPDFGPFCEYSLLAYKFDQLFLDEIVNNYYKANKYEPKTLTCYEHLECDRGPLPSCLDWTDICDGKIDCFNDGLDEKYCWKTEINECNEDEFRCLDGQCIPLTFLREEQSHVDCLDISDAKVFFSILSSFVNRFLGEPTFGMEDVSCIHIADSRLERISSSCVLKRGELLSETLYSIKPKSITSDQCWTVVKCIIHMPISNEVFCRNLCRKKTCDNIVRDTCPDLVYTTAFPIVLGHVFVLYENNHLKYKETTIPQPNYVCYNDTLLYLPSNNEIMMRLDNLTCRFYNTSIIVGDDLERGWIESYIHPLYRWLQLWTSWIYNNSMLCNNTTMYQCMNSSKCISKYRLMDSIQDCFYNDDEDISTLNKNCSTQENLNSFKCETTNECIPRRLVDDNICHCTKYYAKNCDDESSRDSKTRMKIYFTTICDGFIHLFPKLIDNRNQTDETDCDLWPCNNIYTRCNDFWNCPNGADELNCDSSPILQCPSNNHICGSFKTNELMCLPIEKANDGIIDCIGGTDEPIRCRMEQPTGVYKSFHCVNDSRRYCISWQTICDGKTQCEHGDDEKICSSINNDEPSELFCYYGSTSMNSPAAKVFCKPFHELSGNHFNFNYFKLAEITDSSQTNLIKNALVIKNIDEEEDEQQQQQQQRCHRGLESQVWLDKANNLTKLVCFCPPSFYGNFCQYQNQRISITMQFLVSSDTIEIPIIIIISLIDDSDQRMIHSYEQITYLSKKYCQKKFNFYLLYSTRPKNESQQYFIHIDIYQRKSLNYRGSTIKKILFPFLPVYRLAFQLAIPSIHDKPDFCSDNQCRNGKCRKYFHDPEFRTFCQCNSGWSGRYCHIPYDCTCSSDSLCLGKLPTNQSICICPLNKLGSRCFLKNTFLCENNQNHICLNGGQCLIIDEYRTKYRQNLCICPKNFTGEKCEIPQARLLISFDRNIILPTGIHIHFIELDPRKHPAHTVSYRMIPYGQRSMIIYWSYKFHLVFIEWNENYYLTLVQNQHNQSMSIERTIHLSDRCFHIKELMDEGILNYHLLHRIKYYHVLCQRNNSQNIPCFYDEIHLCLCQNHQSQSVANCFEFEHKKKINCLGKSACINDGTCYQDNLACPTTSICICPACYYGAQCQLNTHSFSLSLDAILGFHIQPKYSLSNQSYIVLLMIIITIFIVIVGLINGVLSLMTFKDENICETGCGIYLLCSSILSMIIIFLFPLKFSILLFSQMQLIENELFLNLQCYSMDFLLRFCLTMNQWLTACVSIERTFIIMKGVNFNKKRTKSIAKWIISTFIILIICTTIHDPIYRRLFREYNDEQQRIWCIVEYSSIIKSFDLIMNSLHFILSFLINITSALIIIMISIRQQIRVRKQKPYKQILNEEIQKHKSLLIGPLVLIILAIPRLIISFASGCMKSTNDSWRFLLGYYISLIPPLLTFIIFVLPSTVYKQAFKKTFSRYKSILQKYLHW